MPVPGFQQYHAQPTGNKSQRVLLRCSANRQWLARSAHCQRTAQIQRLRTPQQSLHYAQISAPQAKRVCRTGGHQTQLEKSAQRIQPVRKRHGRSRADSGSRSPAACGQ